MTFTKVKLLLLCDLMTKSSALGEHADTPGAGMTVSTGPVLRAQGLPQLCVLQGLTMGGRGKAEAELSR